MRVWNLGFGGIWGFGIWGFRIWEFGGLGILVIWEILGFGSLSIWDSGDLEFGEFGVWGFGVWGFGGYGGLGFGDPKQRPAATSEPPKLSQICHKKAPSLFRAPKIIPGPF